MKYNRDTRKGTDEKALKELPGIPVYSVDFKQHQSRRQKCCSEIRKKETEDQVDTFIA